MKCPKCKGKGKYDFDKHKYIGSYCLFCHGKKKLDWIEVILGVDRKKSFEEKREEIINELAKELADQIDKEVLKEFGIYDK